METINDRMEMIVNERFKGNKAAFAKTIGLQPTGLSNYLGNKRRSKPSVDMVARIVLSLNVDARWLLTGETEASRPAKNSISTRGDYSPASINGNAEVVSTGDVALLEERIKSLEALLAEKERLISVLMEARR